MPLAPKKPSRHPKKYPGKLPQKTKGSHASASVPKTSPAPFKNDLGVDTISDCLKGRTLDLVVSGSIAAVESVRLIRSLRRLGATVTPWLTDGGKQFVTPMALEWASATSVRQTFSGTETHIATSDAVIVAPASMNTITKIALGITDAPHLAAVASAIGQKKPVFLLPTMHDSLHEALVEKKYLDILSKTKNIFLLGSRMEEGKRKFPDPEILADLIAHQINRPQRPTKKILITMGTTRGYIDDVRYLSNHSTGATGTQIATELFRQGFATHVVTGPAMITPKNYTECTHVETTQEMHRVCSALSKSTTLLGAVFVASVLDFEPARRLKGKISSSADALTLVLKPTPKIIDLFTAKKMIKIGFKLEVDATPKALAQKADQYLHKYRLHAMVTNLLKNTGSQNRLASMHFKNEKGELGTTTLTSQKHLVDAVYRYFVQ